MQPVANFGLIEDFIIPILTLSANSTAIIYVLFTRVASDEYMIPFFSCVLKFVSKEADPATGEPMAKGSEDKY
jgi:coatomer gamma subunit appendage platform-like protein